MKTETINFAEQKILLAQTILSLTDVDKISKIQSFVNKIVKHTKEIDYEFDAKKISFKEWNSQFEDNRDLSTFLPEYGMSLKDFRLKIYNSEKEEGLTKEEFINRVNSWE